MPSADATPAPAQAAFAIHPQTLTRLWGTGMLSTDETLGCLLAYLSADRPAPDDQRPPPSSPNAQLKTPADVLGTLLRQLADALDALTGQQLDLWRAEGLWFWRWEDSGQQAARGLASCGEALTDAVEQRYPADFLGDTRGA